MNLIHALMSDFNNDNDFSGGEATVKRTVDAGKRTDAMLKTAER